MLTLEKFTLATHGVDPKKVPTRTLSSGDKMPAIGAGTFGSDHVTPDQVAVAVEGAASVGYRHFDCASVYENEKEIGVSFQKIIWSLSVTAQ